MLLHSFDPGMGCCLCRPQTEVTEDPHVIAYAEVGYSVVFDDLSDQFNILDSDSGMFYLRGGVLYFESTVCYSFCWKCERREWNLSEITRIEVVQRYITVTTTSNYGTRQCQVAVNLRIAFSNNTTLFAAMPSADSFSARLHQHISSCQLFQNDVEELVRQATAFHPEVGGATNSMELMPLTSQLQD